MGLIGLIAELAVLAGLLAGVSCNFALIFECELFELRGAFTYGSLGLFYFNPMGGDDLNADGDCIKLDKNVFDAAELDAAWKCARVCSVIGLCFGGILFVLVFFKQCLFPLPCSQRLIDLSSTMIQVSLALVYVVWMTDACDVYQCIYGRGGAFLIVSQLSYLGAGCCTRCMRGGRFERRDEISANKEKKATEKKFKDEEQKRMDAEDEVKSKPKVVNHSHSPNKAMIDKDDHISGTV